MSSVTSRAVGGDAEIPLTRGLVAIVDAADYAWLSAYSWCAARGIRNRSWYALRMEPTDGGQKTIWMHREIIGAIDGQQVDHRDCNGLNNRRENLRLATNGQNKANSRKHRMTAGKPCSSRFKGVTKVDRHPNCWAVRIGAAGARHYLGMFTTEIEAAKAYDAAAIKYFGEFARLNFPKESK